ncbi:hypothetical protein [Aquiflexum lacus]|uniref:hypothetical protein n=1 Tax=Aquiflexum lacus TaxID=2483805 RepID=UPI0018942562|nr:hypothetical protein [Aquiflexum lacus]
MGQKFELNKEVSFKLFLEENPDLLKFSKKNISTITNLFPPSIKNDNALRDEKIEEIKNLATSDSFITTISENIGLPLENETKEEFVKRSLNMIQGKIENLLK